MEELNEKYITNETLENRKNLIESERSNTKKLLTKYLIESSNGKINNIDKIFITNAIN